MDNDDDDDLSVNYSDECEKIDEIKRNENRDRLLSFRAKRLSSNPNYKEGESGMDHITYF